MNRKRVMEFRKKRRQSLTLVGAREWAHHMCGHAMRRTLCFRVWCANEDALSKIHTGTRFCTRSALRFNPCRSRFLFRSLFSLPSSLMVPVPTTHWHTHTHTHAGTHTLAHTRWHTHTLAHTPHAGTHTGAGLEVDFSSTSNGQCIWPNP